MPNFATQAPGIDSFDRAILRLVQTNNQISHAAIGEQVGLSGSAVRRRLTAMRASGIIERDVSILTPEAVGETLLVTISFETESPEIYAAFEAQVAEMPEVRQCYHIAGDADYFLVVQVSNLRVYEDWAKAQFMSNPAIRRYDTVVTWSCKKFDTVVAV